MYNKNKRKNKVQRNEQKEKVNLMGHKYKFTLICKCTYMQSKCKFWKLKNV